MKIPELLSALGKVQKREDDHKSRAEKLESELVKKKGQLNEVALQITDNIVALEARESTQGRIEPVLSERSVERTTGK
jgi:hypothetical protein